MTKVSLTHLDKVFWPKEGFTKGDVVRYYDRVAEYILPYLRDRPLVLNRYPNGIAGVNFFQKNVDPKHLPSFVKSVPVRAKSTGRIVHYAVCNNKATLLYLANLGCIEFHPWLSRVRALNRPDLMVIDLDPHGCPFEQVVTVAREARRIIAAAGGRSFVKTSGITGLHVCVPLRGSEDFVAVRAVAKSICRAIHRGLPEITSFGHRPKGRRVYLDYARNSIGQTIAAPYSLRAFPGATVSTPLAWDELSKSRRPGQFAMRTVFRRLNSKGDIWRKSFRRGVGVGRLAKRLEKQAGTN